MAQGALSDSMLDEAKAKWDALDRDGSGDLDAGEFARLITTLATSNWKEAYDPQRGKSYYYNTVTKETRWQQADGDTAVSDFLKENGVSVQPKAKVGIAAIGRAKQQASRLANSEAAQKARTRASEKTAQAKALAREKAERVQASEKFQKASAGASEFYSSAEEWKQEAKNRHRDKLMIAGVSFAFALLLGMMFMYEWATYVPPVPPPAPTPRDTSTGGIGETGQIAALTHEWEWVHLNEKYAHPVVFAGIVSTHEQHTTMEGGTNPARDPAVARIKDIQQGCPGWRGWCFQIRMQEPSCMEDEGVHIPGETLSWMVIDRGVYHMQVRSPKLTVAFSQSSYILTAHRVVGDYWQGQAIQDNLMQAGIVSASGTAFVTVIPSPFDGELDPVVLTQIQTTRDPGYVKTRQRWATGYSGGAFEVKLEQAYGAPSHGREEIGWFAVESSAGALGARMFEATFTAAVDHNARTLNFQSNFSAVPLIFANIGTYSGGESATVRSEVRALHTVRVLIYEDSCADHNRAHNPERLSMFVIQSDAGDNALRAERLSEPSTFCPASGTYFTFVDTGQFVSWSHAKRAADSYVIPTTQRPGMKSHLATIKTRAEQECIKQVASIARDSLQEIAVGWIGATDADWIPHWFDVISEHHGEALVGGAEDPEPWKLHTLGTQGADREVLELTVDQQVDCGSLGKIVGGYGALGINQYIQKTYGEGAEEDLPFHTAIKIEVDFVKVDSWDGELAFMWVEEPENPDVDNPVWQQSLRHGGPNLCGAGWGETTHHISKTVLRAECGTSNRPEWCKTLTLKFNSTLDQHSGDESYGIQNVIISFRDENHDWRWGGDDNTPLARAGTWSAAASDAPLLGARVSPNSPWHPGQPSGPTEHYVAVEWPHWETGAWHDCESETQSVAPTWPRCFYGLHSEPRQERPDQLGPGIRDDVTMIGFPTTQWPTDNRWGLTMVLDLIDNDPVAPIPGHESHLNIMHVGDERGETSPAVWIVPHATERRIHVRTSTTIGAPP